MSSTSFIRSRSVPQSLRSPPPGAPQYRVNVNSGLRGGSYLNSSVVNKANTPEPEISQTNRDKSNPDKQEPAIEQTDNEEQYPDVVRKAFGNRQSDLPYVKGEIYYYAAQKVPNFTRQEWKELQKWLQEHDDLNRYQFDYDPETSELTTMSPLHLHERLIGLNKLMLHERFITHFTPKEWISRLLRIADDTAEYASVRGNGGQKRIADAVQALKVGRELIITSLDETALSQPKYTDKSAEGVLNKLVEMADRLLAILRLRQATREARGEAADDEEPLKLISLSCFYIEELQPGRSQRAKWASPAMGDFYLDKLGLDNANYEEMLKIYPELIQGAGPWRAHDHVFFGAVRVWWFHIPLGELETFRAGVKAKWEMSEWIARGLAIPILESYGPAQQLQVDVFLRKVEQSYKDKLAILASQLLIDDNEKLIDEAVAKLSKEEGTKRYEELYQYMELLLKPPKEATSFAESISRIVDEIKDGAYGTACDRLCDNSHIVGQDTVVLQGGKPGPRGRDTNAEDLMARVVRMRANFLKRKREEEPESDSDVDSDSIDDRAPHGPSTSRG
ncbi:uncharacterized protein B0H18DRAFT_962411 [Fomitopsis serialis]|uniref:uncharacterized protein n=1 Tax=Fomitopsis serialis TaxID=139415 RepID=UPI002008A357|nr:uncharacterized protein B0H18DRAFT_962411 [Neoantrodia serialis]KAH9911257.1 hypothetical protein B0H18DRAFT_962411 [Neoantrodia serialis]